MKKIFIIEDDRLLQELYALILNEAGYELIATAFNGEEAIIKYRNLNETPDIMVLDYRMPLKNGIEVIKEILSLNKEQKFIFVSADTTIKAEAMELGAKGFVEKPFEIKKFLNLLKIIVNEM